MKLSLLRFSSFHRLLSSSPDLSERNWKKGERKMGITNPSREQPYFLLRKLLPWAIYALVPLALFRFYFYPSIRLKDDAFLEKPIIESTAATVEKLEKIAPCDYSNGKWVRDKSGPQYNGTSCGTIKDGQNCIKHGRPDMGYLYWRWRPTFCKLPRFQPWRFLTLMQNKHLAFIGDSMARNQLESLLCLLSSASPPNLVYQRGEENKFRRWNFPSHNVTISIYWSPFLVMGVEKSATGPNHNVLHMDLVDERWASDLGQMDMIVFSAGHWFLHPAVYWEKDLVIGCHYCPGLNHTEVGFYGVFRKAFRTSFKAVIDRNIKEGKRRQVFVTTFSPSHFEGDWDKAGACPKKEPFEEGEKAVEDMNAEMWSIQIEEVDGAKKDGRFEALDVTRLSLMRPDGHPGPYMHPSPFANGVPERVQNDCVHWCLPGPIDTWNEILLELIKRLEEGQASREK